MISEILQAIIEETKALLAETGATIIFKTDYKSTELTSYNMPLVIIDLYEAPDSGQMIGGVSKIDWIVGLNTYNYMPNGYAAPDGGYSTDLLLPIDTVRRHFSKELWLTDEMKAALNDFDFRFTLTGITGADALDEDGIVKGYKIGFDCIGFDIDTNSTIDSSQVLQYVVDKSRVGL